MISPPQTRRRIKQPIRQQQNQLTIPRIRNAVTSQLSLPHQLFRVDRLAVSWMLYIRHLSCAGIAFLSRALA